MGFSSLAAAMSAAGSLGVSPLVELEFPPQPAARAKAKIVVKTIANLQCAVIMASRAKSYCWHMMTRLAIRINLGLLAQIAVRPRPTRPSGTIAVLLVGGVWGSQKNPRGARARLPRPASSERRPERVHIDERELPRILAIVRLQGAEGDSPIFAETKIGQSPRPKLRQSPTHHSCRSASIGSIFAARIAG